MNKGLNWNGSGGSKPDPQQVASALLDRLQLNIERKIDEAVSDIQGEVSNVEAEVEELAEAVKRLAAAFEEIRKSFHQPSGNRTQDC
jgi:molecular chaperone GrpE (heat shock protein)